MLERGAEVPRPGGLLLGTTEVQVEAVNGVHLAECEQERLVLLLGVAAVELDLESGELGHGFDLVEQLVNENGVCTLHFHVEVLQEGGLCVEDGLELLGLGIVGKCADSYQTSNNCSARLRRSWRGNAPPTWTWRN